MNRNHFRTSGVIFVPHGTTYHTGYAFISEPRITCSSQDGQIFIQMQLPHFGNSHKSCQSYIQKPTNILEKSTANRYSPITPFKLNFPFSWPRFHTKEKKLHNKSRKATETSENKKWNFRRLNGYKLAGNEIFLRYGSSKDWDGSS